MKKLFIGYYYAEDSQENNYLHFVADENCNKEAEFKKVFKREYDKEIDNADILGVYSITMVEDSEGKEDYIINPTLNY